MGAVAVRVEDWPERLAAEIDAATAIPFKWGDHDCLTWTFAVRAELTGVDDTHLWRGRYGTEEEAQALMKAERMTLYRIGRKLLGKPLTAPLMAQRGDIVLGEAFGVCTGELYVWPAKDVGMMAQPVSVAKWAWRV